MTRCAGSRLRAYRPDGKAGRHAEPTGFKAHPAGVASINRHDLSKWPDKDVVKPCFVSERSAGQVHASQSKEELLSETLEPGLRRSESGWSHVWRPGRHRMKILR